MVAKMYFSLHHLITLNTPYDSIYHYSHSNDNDGC